MEMGRSGRPWEYLPLALRFLEIAPRDPGLRFLTAANLARLGLVTAAREQLAAMPDQTAGRSEVAQLDQAIGQLPDDRIPAGQLLDTCRTNVEALAARGVDLRAALVTWSSAIGECYRANDGNVVRRVSGIWLGFSDERAAAEDFVRKN